MSLVETKPEFEITKKSLTDDKEIQNAIFYDVPVGFVEHFVLRKPGDFAISKSAEGPYYLSIFSFSKLNNPIIHIRIDFNNLSDEMEIPGMLFARAKSLGKLIYELRNENIEILSGILEKELKMQRFLGPPATKIHNVHQSSKVRNKKVLAHNGKNLIYTGEMEFSDGKLKEVLLEEMSDTKKFFEKLVNGAILGAKKLPVRTPIGAILAPPTLIYDFKFKEMGISLDAILKHRDSELDLAQRIKICSSAVRIMSELHHAEVFHGCVKSENFFAEFVGDKNGLKNYELVFNGTNGLIFGGKSEGTVNLADYDSLAPELAFTRKLTKESGVFNMGRLFEQILKTEILKTYQKSAEEEPRALREMRRLISRATRANPFQRPTMNGIVMMIREVLMSIPTFSPSTSINFVHYDQFADN